MLIEDLCKIKPVSIHFQVILYFKVDSSDTRVENVFCQTHHMLLQTVPHIVYIGNLFEIIAAMAEWLRRWT